jgi:CRISPR-associated exonuclease Cas4
MLIHLEREWEENRFTAEGRVLHERAHEGPDESRPGVRITRGMPVASAALGLAGECDVVEFHRGPPERIVPVEYKRGKPKGHRADEVQLCAQALCLEEMTAVAISSGAIFYGANRRRTDVAFDAELRALTLRTAAAVRLQLTSGLLPTADYSPKKCEACSLRETCQPRRPDGAAKWFERAVRADADDIKPHVP